MSAPTLSETLARVPLEDLRAAGALAHRAVMRAHDSGAEVVLAAVCLRIAKALDSRGDPRFLPGCPVCQALVDGATLLERPT